MNLATNQYLHIQQLTDRHSQSPSCLSIRSQKVLKLFTMPTPSRPFQRKQQFRSMHRDKYEDVGKLIANTSFKSNPHFKLVMSPQCEIEKKNKDTNIRQNKSANNLDKVWSVQKLSHGKQLECRENLGDKIVERKMLDLEIKQVKIENKILKAKINNLEEEQKELKDLIEAKEREIKRNEEESKKIGFDLKRYKQEKTYMEDIILELNLKIQQLIIQRNNQHRQNQQNQQENEKMQVQELRQKFYSLNRSLQGLDVQNMIINRLRVQIEQQKNSRNRLEQENKYLQERITAILSAKRNKASKPTSTKPLKKQLQYSVSFSFERQIKVPIHHKKFKQ